MTSRIKNIESSKNGKLPPKTSGLDRFGTHRFLMEKGAELCEKYKTFGPGWALLICWGLADGRTGEIRGLTVTRLGRLMGAKTRDSARAALNAIIDAGLLVPRTGGVYDLMHILREAGTDVH